MPSMRSTRLLALALGALVLLTALGGCSVGLHLPGATRSPCRRATHIATDRVTQMVDPWPRTVANRNIAFNGERDAGARPNATVRAR